MKRLKRIGLIFSFLLLVITISPAAAQAPGTSTPLNTPSATTSSAQKTTMDILYGNTDETVPRNLSTLTQNAIVQSLAGVTCLLSGKNPLEPVHGKCLGIDTSTGMLTYTDNQVGATQFMGSLIGGTFSIPVSGSDYTKYALSNFGITKTAYAQSNNGLGYDRLQPIVGIWTRFRDIAYLLFVIAFTIIGLAIMFRVKIDARTVMTIQNQIPKIIIALVLVTFSYAIAGFLIDMMYVFIFLFVLAFNQVTPVNINVDENIFGVVNKAFSISALDFTGFSTGIIGISGDVALSVASVFSSMAGSFLDSTAGSLFKIFFTPFAAIEIGCQAFGFIGKWTGLGLVGKIPIAGDFLQSIPVAGKLFGGGSGGCDIVDTLYKSIVGAVFALLTFLIVLIAILFTLFRVWFMLVKSFAYILIDTLIAPLWITAGIFPGSKLNFTTWIRHLMGHLSIFPMTFGVILFGKTIMDAMSSGSTLRDLQGVGTGGPHELFSPPLIGNAVGGADALAAFIGFGFILSMPTILERTKKAVGAMDFGLKDLRTSIGVGTGMGTAGIKTATGDESTWKGNAFQTMGKPKQLMKNLGVPGFK